MRIAERRHDQRRRAVPEVLVGAREVFVYRAEAELAELAQRPTRRRGRPRGGVSAFAPLTGTAPAWRLRLDRLAPEAVLHLVQQLSRVALPQRFTRRLLGATAGNPFFVAETLRHWFEHGLLTTDDAGRWRTPFDERTLDDAELPVPGSIYATVLERVQRLSAAGRRVLEAAAMAGERFTPALLAPACALSELDAVKTAMPC